MQLYIDKFIALSERIMRLKKQFLTFSHWQQHTIFRRNDLCNSLLSMLQLPQLNCCWLLDWTENLQTNLPAYVFFQNLILPLVVRFAKHVKLKEVDFGRDYKWNKDYTTFCLPTAYAQDEHKRIVKTSQDILGRKELS